MAKEENLFVKKDTVLSMNVAEEMRRSFLDYSMSVIVARALPDVRDGLKPSQRRILFAMHDLSLYPNKKHMKCAKICGDTSGNYHPHGESVIYPTLVHMGQGWVMRDPLVHPQGNFGSVEGDPPAAMRYTEARLTHLGASLMDDMDKDTVNFVPNYDERLKEPVVFPAAFPNLLVNGSTGIAVGMATNIPPHNLGEVIDGVCATIDNPSITIRELMKHVKGPDFPTGCEILGRKGIVKYFETGRGGVRTKAKIHIEDVKNSRQVLIVTEIPFNVNRSELVKRIAELVNTKVITEISDVRDESDENTRVVIELKRDAIPKIVINNLYKMTSLQSSFSVNMLAIDGGRPKTLNLKDVLNCYIEHRREVVLRRTRFELRRAESRAELLEGYLCALANLDDFIKIIRKSANREEAKGKLQKLKWSKTEVKHFGLAVRSEQRLVDGNYALNDRQIDAILELRLYQLTGLESNKVKGEYKELLTKIEDLQDILAKESRVLSIIKEELLLIREKYATKRRSKIVAEEGEMTIEDLVSNDGVIITLTHKGLIKRTNLDVFRSQKRGGRGVIGATSGASLNTEKAEDNDFIEHLFTASTHDHLMFFTNSGRVYVERVYEVPEMSRTAKGRSIANLLELRPDENVTAMIRVEMKRDKEGEEVTWQEKNFVFFTTKKGVVKKTPLSSFSNIRKGGIIAIGIDETDRLIAVKMTNGTSEVVLITNQGKSIRFKESEVRSMGRPAAGVRGISLGEEDVVVAAEIVNEESTLLVAGENGIGKRTSFSEYRIQSRGGKGIITMKTTKKTGNVIGALTVDKQGDIMLITEKGIMVRTGVKGIRKTGRNAQGVKLINIDKGGKLLAIAPVISEKEAEEKVEVEAAPLLPKKEGEEESPI